MESSQTRICSVCKRELPLEMFGKGNCKDGRRSQCKDCINKMQRDRRNKNNGSDPNPDLAGFTPQELICELRARGYEGSLTFTEVKIHRIKV